MTVINFSFSGNKCRMLPIGLITVYDAILTSRPTRLEITVFVWKTDVKQFPYMAV